mgnify:CR=1 FL=1
MDVVSLRKNQQRYHVWLDQSKYDIRAAEISYENGSYEWACYQSVQSVEKALKAVLVHAGWRAPMTHKLGVLMSMSNHANELFFDVKMNLRKLEAYTFVARYPFVYPNRNVPPHEMIHKDDAEVCINIAKDVYWQIDHFLAQNKIKREKTITVEEFYFSADEIQRKIDEIVDVLKRDQTMKVSKIILFGSFAREKTRPMSSTMDILVIADTSMGFIDRIKYVRDLTHGTEPIIEPLVYTQQEFDFMLKEEGEGFLESAIEEGKVIFDESSTSTNLHVQIPPAANLTA